VLAGIFLLFGTCTTVPLAFSGFRGGAGSLGIALGALFYVAPGAAYLVLMIYLKRRRFWAVVATIVVAAVQCLFMLMGMVFGLIFAARGNAPAVTYVVAAFLAFVCLALAQLIYHLALSFDAIKHLPLDEQRGFEPLMVTPVVESRLPTPPTSPSTAAGPHETPIQ
jgi:hypothetical protein